MIEGNWEFTKYEKPVVSKDNYEFFMSIKDIDSGATSRILYNVLIMNTDLSSDGLKIEPTSLTNLKLIPSFWRANPNFESDENKFPYFLTVQGEVDQSYTCYYIAFFVDNDIEGFE